MHDARTSGWYAWRKHGRLLPIAGGDEDPPKDPPETVSKEEYDKAVKLAEKRDGLLRSAQKDMKKLKDDQTLVLEALGLDLPDDPEERKTKLDELRASREKQRDGKTLSKEEVDRLLAERDRKHTKELDTTKALADTRLKKLRVELIDNQARAAAAEFGALDHAGVEGILYKVRDEADILEEDGELKAIIKGKDGARLTGAGEHMTVRDRVKEISEDAKYASWFRAAGRPGSGTPPAGPGSGTKGGKVRITRAQMNSDYYEKHRDEIHTAQTEGRLEITD